MISLHLRDGQTIPIDLADGVNPQLERLGHPDFQAQLTAVTVHLKYPHRSGETGVQISLVRPKGFDDEPFFQVERVKEQGRIRVGERIDLWLGDLRVSLMMHGSQPAARLSVTKKTRER